MEGLTTRERRGNLTWRVRGTRQVQVWHGLFAVNGEWITYRRTRQDTPQYFCNVRCGVEFEKAGK